MGDSPASVLVDPASGDTLAVVTDGSDKKLDITTKVRDSAGSVISPAIEGGNLATLAGKDFATQTTLAAIKDKTDNIPADPAREGGNLATLAGKDFSTETTLAAIKGKTDYIPSDPAREGGNLATLAGKDFATQTTLAEIMSTNGVKKITDPLPAGTNEIGKTAQGTRAAASAGWPVYIVDDTGNKVGLILDGAIYRLQTDSKLAAGTNEVGKVAQGTRAAAAGGWPMYVADADGHVVGVILDGSVYRFAVDAKVGKGSSDLVHLDVIDTTSGQGRLKSTLYTQDGDPVSFGSVPPNPESIKNAFILNGSNDSLLVDGSSTPVVFSYDADSTHDISVQELKFVMAANGITFGTDKFGVITKLTNGLLIELTADGNTGTVANLVSNECFAHLSSPGGFIWVVSSKDMLAVSYVIGGSLRLKAGTTDKVKVTVRDNLSAAATYLKCCVKGNLLEA